MGLDPPMKKLRTPLLALMSICTLGACDREAPVSGGDIAGCATRAYDTIGGPINLVDHNGKAVTEEDFKGRDTLVYFGFTHCPDVCPATLSMTGAALDLLPDDMEKPLTMLIGVDTERDTPESLTAYIESNGFPEDMVGLSGDDAAIRAAANAFKSDYKRVELPDSAAGYTMDHLSVLYLMDKDWKLKTFFPSHEAYPQAIATCLESLAD